MMGYLSCNRESSIATACDSRNFKLSKTQPLKNNNIIVIEFSYSDLHSSTNGFSQSHLLGKGSHGSVFRAHNLPHSRCQLIAAVKKTNPTSTAVNPTESEIEILSRVRHSRLVNLLGHSVDSDGNRLIVVEYMPNGSLFDLLHCSTRPTGWTRRVRFALQVAKAVRFLHSCNPPVIHRDIKSSNVLIDANFNARLGDFGLALRGHAEDVRMKSTPPAGTLGYLDPSYLTPGDLSTKSDVFSFGILLLEIVSGRNAIDVNYSPPSVVDWALPSIRSGGFVSICDPRIGPPGDEAALLQLAVLAARCVRSEAAKRPAMAEVVECLKQVYKRVNHQVWNNLGRRVDCLGDSAQVTKYEPLDDEESGGEATTKAVRGGGSWRNRKVSSVGSVHGEGSGLVGAKGCDHFGRSRSIGSFGEIESGMLDIRNNNVGRRRVGLAVKMPTIGLSKSRSMGMLRSSSSSRLLNNSGSNNNNNNKVMVTNEEVTIKLVRTPNGKELEVSKLLVNSRKQTQKHD